MIASTKKPYFGLTGGWLTFWLTVACATDMMLFGYDQGVFSGVVVTPDFLEVHDLVGPTKTKVLSTVAAIYDIGCFFGAILAFTLGERLGRKKAILLGTVIIAVGTVLQASSYSLPQIFIGRIVLGLGNGINTATAPIWQTETAQAKWRGKLVILDLGLNVGGYCIVNWINYGLSFRGGAIAWRMPIALQLTFVAVLLVTIPWLPESPRWLMTQAREDEAMEVLACIEATSINDPVIITQRDEIKFSITYEQDNSVRWRDLLRRGKADNTKTLRRLLLGAGTQAMQQLQVLMNSVGLSDKMARLLTACNATSYFIFSCAAASIVERVGRRGLMMLSGFGQFISFLVITILLYLAENNKVYATASVAFFFLYHIAFGMGMLGVPWLYPTEINSLPMRTKGVAVSTATNWITNFAIVEITPIGIQSIGWKFWIVWTVLNAVFLPIIYFIYPETANRKLEDIDAYYRTNPPLIVVGDADAISTKRPLQFVYHEDEEVQKNAKDIAAGAVEYEEHVN
ncbi:Major facilitator superfamily domain, general substrate transporter [Penicillium expansum]|uniref:Major facilitator superfamily domain, general substrate transporter n=1 Tax=Penicillium expansum TaxID=27334 RepID=A0A0A2IT62_PENEN|nr:Major facilitator superfamily domain, general substrate transporter [Penicillium expansum]KGO46254.1 Major facilitator superfamily domain, general substrate transporter [Penicillium expansum]KGO50464.1 Major facilitator superfamily domain, general substrate transporter [Penicillium expansum]KGO58205.1 Major facilitator superfamily domain, general substrate transporter [Penicillium expansum]